MFLLNLPPVSSDSIGMQFCTAKDCREAAEKRAIELIKLHREKGHDLNPYCTQGARSEFQRAFDNGPFYSFESQTRDFDFRFQLGQAVARLLNSQKTV